MRSFKLKQTYPPWTAMNVSDRYQKYKPIDKIERLLSKTFYFQSRYYNKICNSSDNRNVNFKILPSKPRYLNQITTTDKLIKMLYKKFFFIQTKYYHKKNFTINWNSSIKIFHLERHLDISMSRLVSRCFFLTEGQGNRKTVSGYRGIDESLENSRSQS